VNNKSFLGKEKKKLEEYSSAAKDTVKENDKKKNDVNEKTKDESSTRAIDKVKRKQGIISKIQNFFTLGYSTKEDLRELDKKLRDSYYSDFKGVRHRWEEIYFEALKAKVQNKDDYKKVIQVIDRVAEKINRADYGYAGLMDRKGHIRENELAKIFDYDKSFWDKVDNLKQAVENIGGLVEAESWSETLPKVREVKVMLRDIEEKWEGREKEFRLLEV
jgi:hypothetical protein